MTEFTITSGTASYQRVRRPADFESQTPSLTLNFEVANGADPEVVTAKVMLMCRKAVEGTFTVSTLATSQAILPSVPSEPVKPKRTAKNVPEATVPDGGGSAATPTEPAAASLEADNPLATLADATQEAQAAGEDELAALAGGDEPQYTAADVQSALMKASEHLRKEFGHINDIKKLIASFNIAGYASLKPERYSDFIGKAKALCDLKKS